MTGTTRRDTLRIAAAATAAAFGAARPLAASPLQGEGLKTTPLGDVEIVTVSDGRIDMPLSAFPNLGRFISTGAAESVPLGALAYVIRLPGRTVLVDAGAGTFHMPSSGRTGLARGRLMAGGLDPADVTDVVLTHMHPDHAGGLLEADMLAYPNAAIHVTEAEWAHWTVDAAMGDAAEGMRGTPALARRLAELAPDRVVRHGGMADLGGGLHFDPAPGHSPGHACVHLEAGGRQVMMLGDTLVTAPAQLLHPELTCDLDLDHLLAIETRARLFDRIATDGIAFSATHLTTLSLGTLRREGDGYAFSPA